MYNTNSGCTMSDSGSVEDNGAVISSENTEEEFLENRTLTEEAVSEQIKSLPKN